MKAKFILLILLFILTACDSTDKDAREYIRSLETGDIVKYDLVVNKTTTIYLDGKTIDILEGRVLNREGDYLTKRNCNYIQKLHEQKALIVRK